MPFYHRFKKHSKIVPFIVLSILAVGFGAALRLLPQTQTISPKAAETPAQYGSMPLGDLSYYSLPPNPIQTFNFLSFQTKDQLLASIGDTLKYHKAFFYTFHNIVGIRNPDFTPSWETNQILKTRYPDLKIGYFSVAVLAPSYMAVSHIFNDAEFLHKKDGSLLWWLDDPIHQVNYMNITNPQVRSRIKDFYLDVWLNKNTDIIFTDSYDAFISQQGYKGTENGCLEGACETAGFWFNNLDLSSREIFENTPAGKEFLYNGIVTIAPADTVRTQYGGPMYANFLQYHHGALAEWGPSILNNQSDFKRYLEQFKDTVSKGKKIYFFVQPKLMCPATTDPATNFNCANGELTDSDGTRFNFAIDLNMERFFLSYYLLFQHNPLTFFGYHPGVPYIGYAAAGGGVYHYADWFLNFGKPLTDYGVDAQGNYYRSYENGVAVVNPTAQYHQFKLSPQQEYSFWDPCSGPYYKDLINVSPKAGLFLFYKDFGCDKPGTPTLRPGDIGGNAGGLPDGKVNIQDYVLLFESYGKKSGDLNFHQRADINNDTVVNILDYVILYDNFGK